MYCITNKAVTRFRAYCAATSDLGSCAFPEKVQIHFYELLDQRITKKISEYDSQIRVSLTGKVAITQLINPFKCYRANSNEASNSREIWIIAFKSRGRKSS